MKLNKVLGTYLMDLGEQIAQQSEPLCPLFLTDLFMVLNKFELKKEEKKDCKEEDCKEESITDKAAKEILEKREGSLVNDLMRMLGCPSDILGSVGEHMSSIKPTIKIRIKKVSSSDDLEKILKEMKDGGVVDLNSANDKLGEIFDLNSIQEILDTPMFKDGGNVELIIEQKELTLKEFLNN